MADVSPPPPESPRPVPPGPIAVQSVRKSELRDPAALAARWDDPDGVASLADAKRLAMLDNPLSEDESDLAQLVGTKGDRVVGRVDMLPGAVILAGEKVPLMWTSLLHVPEEYRGTLMGAFLPLKMQQSAPAVGACGVSQRAVLLYEKLKWLDIGMPRYVAIRRSRAIVEKYLGEGLGGRIAAWCVDVGMGMLLSCLRLARVAASRGLRVESVAAMPEELEPLLVRVTRGEQGPATVRSVAWINWALRHSLDDHPRNRRGLFLVRDRSGRTVAYFMASARFHETATQRNLKRLYLGSLKDWAIFEPNTISLQQLVALALREIARWDVDATEVCIPPDCSTAIRPSMLGMVRAGDLHLLVKASSGPLAAPACQEPSRWRVRPADGDNFFN
jgi:hypothetical protein